MIAKLPNGWTSTPLDQVFEPRSTRVSPSELPDAPYIGLEHVEAQTGKLLTTVPASAMSSSSARFFAGDVLYGRMGHEPGMLGAIFFKAQNKIQDPAKLSRLVQMIDAESWVGMTTERSSCCGL